MGMRCFCCACCALFAAVSGDRLGTDRAMPKNLFHWLQFFSFTPSYEKVAVLGKNV